MHRIIDIINYKTKFYPDIINYSVLNPHITIFKYLRSKITKKDLKNQRIHRGKTLTNILTGQDPDSCLPIRWYPAGTSTVFNFRNSRSILSTISPNAREYKLLLYSSTPLDVDSPRQA